MAQALEVEVAVKAILATKLQAMVVQEWFILDIPDQVKEKTNGTN
jgi:hypothetical protein